MRFLEHPMVMMSTVRMMVRFETGKEEILKRIAFKKGFYKVVPIEGL